MILAELLSLPSVYLLQEHLVREGMSWVDDQGGGKRLYWFPGLFTET